MKKNMTLTTDEIIDVIYSLKSEYGNYKTFLQVLEYLEGLAIKDIESNKR